jgi:hypothetical protein
MKVKTRTKVIDQWSVFADRIGVFEGWFSLDGALSFSERLG